MKIKSVKYNQKKFFLREKDFFIKNSWFLVGHLNDLKNENDFKTFDILGNSVLLFKFRNKIKAFTNICSHRGCKIKAKFKGNEKLVCPYHAWSYDDEGYPKNIPMKKECFDISKKDFKKLRLENWNVDYCGNFIFLSNKKNTKNLKSYLGEQYRYLKDISHKIQECIHSAQWTWKCNWKICLENSIDEYHAIFVHPTTFKKLVNPKPKYYFEGNVMGMDLPLSDSYIKDFDKLKKYFKNNSNKYSHFLIFPLSTIATTMEHSFFLQRYMPIDEHNTLVTSEIYVPNLNKEIIPSSVKNFFIDSCKNFNEIVFNEDKLICENVHDSLKQKQVDTIIGKYERRIELFRKKMSRII